MPFCASGRKIRLESGIALKEAIITVEGIVQQVGFRYFTVKNAERLGVKGYVQNLDSGSVEIVAQVSDETKIEELIEILKKGPPSAVITDIRVDYNNSVNREFPGFDVRY